MVNAGPAVDSVLGELGPLLQPGDIVIDGGNSHFKDTDRRAAGLRDRGVHYLGVGISGGESGARHGPSMMPGGPAEAYEAVRPLFEAVAAQVDGRPCVAHLGPGSAGHYVKMVHNGIEYAVMQLIAESLRPAQTGTESGQRPAAAICSPSGRKANWARICWRSPRRSSAAATSRPAGISSTSSPAKRVRRARACGPPRAPWIWACPYRASTPR